MKISVIIPAYNAAAFVSEAVSSAFSQAQTEEVIVVDDGSTDETKSICTALQHRYPNLKVLEHPDKKNHGAGPSRNLGIKNAVNDFIAFLDADDFYLPERFSSAEKAFSEHPDADGIYECLGIYFQTEESKITWYKRFDFELTTIKEIIPPEELIYKMAPLGKSGWFSGDALVVRKNIFEKSGYYSDLRLSQDTELFMKMAITSKLYPGNILTPVANRRVHNANRVTAEKVEFFKNRKYLWNNMLQWTIKTGQNKKWIAAFQFQRFKSGLIAASLEKNIFTKFGYGISALVEYIFSRNWFYFFFGN